ncbi:MAG: hypothetical protein CL908_10675 [Deltaproteobacteria bacterium]|nr:hypothetical protein [Deltaproteobacteria bacterium]
MSLPPFHPFALEYTADPKPYFAEFHRDNRLVEVPDLSAFAVHGYEAVRAFCDHPQANRNLSDTMKWDEATLKERAARWPMIEGGFSASAMEGTRSTSLIRDLLGPEFRPRMIHKMSATVKDVVAKICAPLQYESELDAVKLIREVPLQVITGLLGINEAAEDKELFLTAAPEFFRGVNFLSSDEVRDRAEIAGQNMLSVLGRAVESRRSNPQNDLISQVIAIGNRLEGVTNDDIVRAVVILVAAGSDTTRLSSSLAVKTLLSHPEQFEALREDRDHLKNAVMELLRYEGATKFLVRAAVEDIEWEGQTIPAGSILLLSIFGAGWDPRVFPNPEVFDYRRDVRGSLSFGFGSGYCLGAHLARLQLGEIIRFFLDHLPSTATFDEEQITWDPRNLFLREITSMPIRVR